jgi:hypothetical protein
MLAGATNYLLKQYASTVACLNGRGMWRQTIKVRSFGEQEETI